MTGIPPNLRERLHDLDGRRLLHLGCGTGEATVELAELGALVTGVDSDPQVLAAARALGAELPWLHGDAEHLPPDLQRGRIDVVYATGRSLADATELDGWAAGIAACLRPGGELILHTDHPVARHLDAAMRWQGDYFAAGAGPRTGAVVSAVAGAGLILRRLEELRHAPPLRPQAARAPGELLLVAARPD